MKKIFVNKQPIVHQRIAENMYNFTNTLHNHGKMRNNDDFAAVAVQSLHKSHETIFLQTLIRNINPKCSFPKKVWVSNVNHFTDLDLSKVDFEDINQKSDIRFLSELRIASKISNLDKTIKGVTLRHEPHGKERGFDLLIHFQHSVMNVTIMRDVKSGNINLSDLHKKYASEIPIVKQTGEPYYILNEISSLPSINKAYVDYIKTLNITGSHYNDLKYRVMMIDNDTAGTADHITKFQQMQEAFLNYTAQTQDKTPLKFAIYVLDIVDESKIVVPQKFSLELQNLLEDTCLLTAENSQKLVGTSMGLYAKHVNSYNKILESSESYLNSIGVTNYISKNV